MSPQIPDDLSWLALQYICDELSPADREAFEAVLAEDQLAREAVAEAVECCSAVRVACGGYASPVAVPASPVGASSPPLQRRSAWRRSFSAVAWMVSGAAACLLAIVVLRDEPQPDQQPLPSAAETAQRLALAQAYVASDYTDVLHTWPSPAEGALESAFGSEDEFSAASALGGAEPSFESVQITRSDATGGSWTMEPLHAAGDDWMLALVALDGQNRPDAPEQDN